MTSRLNTAVAALGAALTFAVAPACANTLTVRGRGLGHGVGMSQWGAYGYAKHGFTYEQILAHYYTGTALTTLSSAPRVGVLLAPGRSRATFKGATRAGKRRLSPRQTYRVRAGAGGVVLTSRSGRALAAATSLLRVSAGGTAPVALAGVGSYRGALEFRSAGSRMNVINAVGAENYVRGVVAAESPSAWPQAALRAQAVAARTYALTSDVGTKDDGYTQYPDTRSQVYKGVAAETKSTDAAVAATRRQVVTYKGKPVTTYFFSTSGGQTENIENSFIGAAPEPYLKAVEDPYDDASPQHTWGPVTFTSTELATRLGTLLLGTFERLEIVRRGASPRVVEARIVGSAGDTTVSGAQLRRSLGLNDTWIAVSSDGTDPGPAPGPVTTTPGDPSSGGAGPG